jgi:uncharacterized membrane protein SpoIIM required for sporulation
MVLESVITTEKAEKRPWELFFIGMLYASVAVFLSLWIFKQYSSLVMIFLTVVASVPLMYTSLKSEEGKEINIATEKGILNEHRKLISFLIFLFLGFLVAFSLWYILLPADTVQNVFHIQVETISAINSRVGENIGGHCVSGTEIFNKIFFNNIKVLLFCIFFAFFYGAGAIFILTWNASVIAAAVGTFVRNDIARIAGSVGFTKGWGYFNLFSAGLLRYLIHGIPEITAYFIGGIAGGIISFAMINHDFGSKRFKKVMIDALLLTVIAIGMLIIAGLVEVYVTPLSF